MNKKLEFFSSEIREFYRNFRNSEMGTFALLVQEVTGGSPQPPQKLACPSPTSPHCFDTKILILEFLCIFLSFCPKCPPPVDRFIGRKINSLECASLFLLMMHIPNKTVNLDCRYSIRPKNKYFCFRKWGWGEKSSPGWLQFFFMDFPEIFTFLL